MFGGESIAGLDTPTIAQRGIAFVPENMGLFTDLTVQENLVLAARSGPPDAARLEWLFGLFPPLKTFWRLSAGNLSGGQKQMLSVARALIEPRRLILIDEPTKGLAPAIVKSMTAAIAELKRANTTILLVEQNFAMASQVGDTVAVMDDGRIVHAGTDGGAGGRRRAAGAADGSQPGGAPMSEAGNCAAHRAARLLGTAGSVAAGAAGAGRGARRPGPDRRAHHLAHPHRGRAGDGHDDLPNGVRADRSCSG